VVNGEALEQSNLLEAVDVCFKAFYCFDIHYPKQCARLGIFAAGSIWNAWYRKFNHTVFLCFVFL